VLVPEIAFQTNDARPVVRGTANGRGAPLLLMNRYASWRMRRPVPEFQFPVWNISEDIAKLPPGEGGSVFAVRK
jgi:hypothetical protein